MLQIFEEDITAFKMKNDDGLVIANSALINLPVMAWYNHNFKQFAIGGGAGLNVKIFLHK